MKSIIRTLSLLAVIFLFVGSAQAEMEKSKGKTGSMKGTPGVEMTEEQQAMMAEAEKRGSPSEKHQVFDGLVGKWNHTTRWWMNPDSTPAQSKGTNTNRWIYGKRYLEQKVQGNAMGRPFEGMGIAGYDNIKEEYTTFWIDNMSTSMMMGHATFEDSSKTFTEAGTMSCPMTGEKDMPYRAVWKIKDHDHYTYEMYVKDKAGKDYKSLEVSYVRAGQPKVSSR